MGIIGKNVILDRQNFDVNQRRLWLAIARDEFPHVRVVCWVLRVNIPEIERRLRLRTNHPTIDNPQLALSLLDKFCAMWQDPSTREGFSSIENLPPVPVEMMRGEAGRQYFRAVVERAGAASSGSGSRSGTPGSSSSSSSSSSTKGGGSPLTISSGSTFAGRTYGGGTRSSISSGASYGSGYGGYRSTPGYVVKGLGFPYGYWPLYYGAGYRGDDEQYGPHSNSSRPGGALSAASFSPPSSGNTTSASPPHYSLEGDAASIGNTSVGVLSALVNNCSAVIITPSTPLTDDATYPPSTNITLLPLPNPSYVDSFYRASSFALYSYYSDKVDTNSNTTTNFTVPQPTPVLISPAERNETFEACVNNTIALTLPIDEGATSWGMRRAGGPRKSWESLVVVLLVMGGGRKVVVGVALTAVVVLMLGS
ncbi:hypothetical protein MNV49_001891 [Pseudohyphozyma bogoriensis]|nr:hypothetical protein MNV49_001891 [Pseudohyphozyma bogoriensis]